MARLVADLEASRATRAARGLHTELSKIGAEAKVLDARFSQAEVGSQKYARATIHLQRALKRGVIDQKEHDRLLGIAKAKYGQAAQGAEQWGAALQKAGRQMSDIGGQLTRMLTLPIAALGAGSVKLASDFESSFAGVRKTVNATDVEFAALAQGMRDLSKEIPVNVNELNKIGEAAGQLGIKKDNILAFTRTIADLSVTTNLASDEAATMLARFDNITTGGAQRTFQEIGSTIVALGNNLATTEREIAEMALRLSGTGAQIGLTQADILSLAGALSSLGLEAEAGGTAFSRVMVEMQNAVLDGGRSLQLFTEIAGSDFTKVFKADAALAINQFIAGLARMSEEGRNINPILDELGLGGIRVSDSLRRTGNAVERVSEAVAIGRKAWADNNALAKEAEERYKTFASQLTVFWNQLKDVGITLGTALLPAIMDIVKGAEPMIDRLGRMAKWFADLDSATQKWILSVFALTAALGPLLLVLGQLAQTVAALSLAFPALGAKLGLMAAAGGPIALLAVALVGIGVAAHEGISRWRRESEEGINAIIAANNRARESIALLKAELASGVIMGSTLIGAINRTAELGFQIQTVEERIRSLKSELKDSERGILDSDRMHMTAGAAADLRREIEKEEEALSNLKSEMVVVDGAIKNLRDITIDFGEEIEKTTGPPGGIKELPPALQKALESISATIIETDALINSLAHSQEAYDTLNALLQAGVPLNDALSGAYDKQARVMLTLQEQLKEMIALREREKELLEQIRQARLDNEFESDFPIPDTIEPPNMEPAVVEWKNTIEEMDEAWREGIGKMSLEMEAIQRQAWANAQDIASGAIASIIKDGKVDFKSLADSILDVIAQMLAKMLIIWLANTAKRLAAEYAAAAKAATAWQASGSASGGGGGWMGALKSLFGMGGGGASTGAVTASYDSYAAAASAGAFEGGAAGASSGIGGASWGTLGVMFGTAAAAVIIAELGNSWIAGKKQKNTAGTMSIGVTDGVFSGESFASGKAGQLNEQMVAAYNHLRNTFKQVEAITGSMLQTIPNITVNVKGTGDIWVTVGAMMSRKFKDMDEALSYALAEGLKQAEFTGLSPQVAAALKNTTAETFEQLQSDLAIALRSEELVTGQVGKTEIRNVVNEWFAFIQEELRLGIVQATGQSGGLKGLVSFFVDSFNEFKGIEKSPAEAIRGRAEALKAELAIAVANLSALKAELLAKKAGAVATGAGAQATAANARVQAESAAVTAAAAKATGAYAETIAAQAQAAVAAAEANAAALAAIDEALAVLANLQISEADIQAAINRARNAGKGGGSKKSDMEDLVDLLDQMAFDRLLAGMTELEAGLARLEREYQDNLEKAHGNADLIARLTEEYRLQAEQLRRNVQLSAVEAFQDFMGIGADPFSQLREGFESVKDVVRDAGFGATRTARTISRLNREYEKLLATLSQQQFVAIGDGLIGILERYYGGVEGFEEFRMDLERIRAELELANLRAQFEILKAQGSLSDAVLARMGEIFDFIDTHPIDWEKFVTPPAPDIEPIRRVNDGFRDTNNLLEEMARRLVSAKEGISKFLQSLQTGQFGGVSTMDSLAAARAQFEEVVKQARAGNVQAFEAFPEVSQTLLDLARKAFASSPEFQDIFRLVQSAGIELLGVSRVTKDNVIFDERFFVGQQQQASAIQMGSDRTTNAVHAGAERTSAAVDKGARATVEAINRQGERTAEGLRGVQGSLAAVLAGQQRRRGAA